jgi:4-amino-4-deoxy-L-arabinose transferase-like glycosyltransferase
MFYRNLIKPSNRYPFIFILIGVAASIILFSFMRFGPGVSPDSVSYLETANSLLNGDGFTVYLQPMTHFPPFYSLMLAVGGLLPIRLIAVSKLLQAGIFGINLSIFLFTTWIGSKRNKLAPLAALLLFLTSTHIILVHSNVWSEGLFFLLGLLGIISLAYYLEFQDRRLLFLSAVLIGLSILTRYAGLAFLPPVILFVLLQARSSFRKKLIDSFLLSLIALLPLALWILRNLVLVNSTANRTFTYHPIQGKHFLDFFNTFSQFFLPSSIPSMTSSFFTILFLAGLFVLIFIYLRIQCNHFKSASFYLVLLLFVYSIEYFIFIFI